MNSRMSLLVLASAERREVLKAWVSCSDVPCAWVRDETRSPAQSGSSAMIRGAPRQGQRLSERRGKRTEVCSLCFDSHHSHAATGWTGVTLLRHLCLRCLQPCPPMQYIYWSVVPPRQVRRSCLRPGRFDQSWSTPTSMQRSWLWT